MTIHHFLRFWSKSQRVTWMSSRPSSAIRDKKSLASRQYHIGSRVFHLPCDSHLMIGQLTRSQTCGPVTPLFSSAVAASISASSKCGALCSAMSLLVAGAASWLTSCPARQPASAFALSPRALPRFDRLLEHLTRSHLFSFVCVSLHKHIKESPR